MRILQIVHEFPPEAWAGTGVVTLYLSQALQARGHEVRVVTRLADPAAEEFSVHEQTRYGLPVSGIVNNYTKTTTHRLDYENDFFDEAFSRLLERHRPDVVHFQHVAHLSATLISLSAALGYPTVLSLHDFYFACDRIHLIDTRDRLCPGPGRGERCPTCLQGLVPKEDAQQRFPFMETVLRAPDIILTPSHFLAQRMLEYLPTLQPRLRVAPLGVVRPMVTKRGTHRVGEPLRILYVGMLAPLKGAHVLLEAVRGLPSAAFAVSLYGGADPYWRPYVDRLQTLATGLAVRFCGVYAHEELSAILGAHDVVVMPGLCEETFSLVTREALLAGLPVIAARRGALPEAVRDGENGFLFEAENPADLRRCLSRLLTEPELLERLRAVDPQVKTMDEYARDMEGVYNEVGADSRRLPSLRQRLTEQHQAAMTLRQESSRLQQELRALQQRSATLADERAVFDRERPRLEQERDEARHAVRQLQALLAERDGQVRERNTRLEAIYASTTWKFYRLYEALTHFLYRRPLRLLRRWLCQ